MVDKEKLDSLTGKEELKNTVVIGMTVSYGYFCDPPPNSIEEIIAIIQK